MAEVAEQKVISFIETSLKYLGRADSPVGITVYCEI